MSTPPREGFRAVFPATMDLEERAEGNGRTLSGHFAVFNKWTLIDSAWEGRFRERVAPGSFAKTFKERTPKVLFQHGRDPQVGNKPLGTITSLREDETGAAYVVDMLDTSYNRDLIPGLKAGVYGASFRFSVTRQELEENPKPSEENPEGIPERTIKEAAVTEFGPVTFGAYSDASSRVRFRSITDDVFLRSMATADPDRLARFLGEDEALLHALVEIAKDRKIIDLGTLRDENERTVAMTVRTEEKHENPPAEDAGQSSTSDARRDESFIKIGSLLPLPRLAKEKKTS